MSYNSWTREEILKDIKEYMTNVDCEELIIHLRRKNFIDKDIEPIVCKNRITLIKDWNEKDIKHRRKYIKRYERFIEKHNKKLRKWGLG